MSNKNDSGFWRNVFLLGIWVQLVLLAIMFAHFLDIYERIHP